MNLRDLEYIENRLTSPVTDALDAVERLRKVGLYAEAQRVMEAAQTFTDLCRSVRRDVVKIAHDSSHPVWKR